MVPYPYSYQLVYKCCLQWIIINHCNVSTITVKKTYCHAAETMLHKLQNICRKVSLCCLWCHSQQKFSSIFVVICGIPLYQTWKTYTCFKKTLMFLFVMLTPLPPTLIVWALGHSHGIDDLGGVTNINKVRVKCFRNCMIMFLSVCSHNSNTLKFELH